MASLFFPDQEQINREVVAVTSGICATGKGTERITGIRSVFLKQKCIVINLGLVQFPAFGVVKNRLRNNDLVK